MIRQFFRHIYYAISNLISYLPILIKDRDWTPEYIFILLQHKLRRVKKSFSNIKYMPEKGRRKILGQLATAIKLIDNIVENDFCKEEHAFHDLIWGELEMKTGKETEAGYPVEFSRPKAVTKEQKELEHRRWTCIMNMEEERRKKAINDLFQIISKGFDLWED